MALIKLYLYEPKSFLTSVGAIALIDDNVALALPLWKAAYFNQCQTLFLNTQRATTECTSAEHIKIQFPKFYL